MKIFKLLFAVILLSAIVIAQGTAVSISNGSGDGNVRGQQITHIWANPNPNGQVFDRWIGDTVFVQNPFEYHTKIKTGVKKINLTATFKSAPNWTPTAAETIGTSQMRYYFPPNFTAVIFHFHGSGGSLNGLFDSIEQRIFANDAVAENYAVVTLNSEDRVNKQWNPNLPPNNPDIINVQAAITALTQRGFITSTTPIFASGISNGGGFAPRVSLALNFRGTAINIAAGTVGIMTQTNVPTIWSVSQNDSTIGSSGIQQSQTNFANLQSRGIRSEYNLLKPSPVYPERFWRIPNVTQNDSQTVYNLLKTNGVLDERDFQIQNPATSGWQNFIPNSYPLFDIFEQLKICFTEHEFHSDHNRRILMFFNSLR